MLASPKNREPYLKRRKSFYLERDLAFGNARKRDASTNANAAANMSLAGMRAERVPCDHMGGTRCYLSLDADGFSSPRLHRKLGTTRTTAQRVDWA